MKTFIFLLVPFLQRALCFIHCEGKAAKGGGILMTIMIPSCNAHAHMKFLKKNFAPHAKNATVKNIITINKYNVGMKSLDRAIIVSDTLKTETSPIYFLGSSSGFVSVSGSGYGFQLFYTPLIFGLE